VFERFNPTLRWLVLLAALAAFSLIRSPQCRAASYYVAKTGSDGGTGTIGSPWLTIAYGLTRVGPGDTLFIRAGAYAESLGPNGIPSGSSWSAPITVTAYPGESVTIRPSAGGYIFKISSTGYLILKGLILDAANVNYALFLVNAAIAKVHHIRLQDSEVKNSLLVGVYVGPDSSFNEFINLKVHHNPVSHGFYINGTNNLIEHCDVHDNGKYGISVYNGYMDSSADYNVVRFNKIHDNSKAEAANGGLGLTSGSGNTAHNNLIWGNAGSGVLVNYRSIGSRIYNNTIFNNSGGVASRFGIYLGTEGGSSGADVRNNIVYQNADGNIVSGGQPNVILTNNLTADPLFVNPGAADFRLLSGSPAIDRGVTLLAYALDFEGTPRPLGAAFDLGAYEHPAGAPPPESGPSTNGESRAPQRFLSPGLQDGVNDNAVFGTGAIAVTIFDAAGRQVFSNSRSAGDPRLSWNCRDASGRLVDSGVYIARIRKADNGVVLQTFAVVK